MSLPRWWGNERKRQNDRSAKQENDHAKATGGKRQAGSGSSWRAPQDVQTEETLDQLKYTDKGSFTIKHSEWWQLQQDAIRAGREPRMIIEFASLGVVLEVREYATD